MVLGKLKQNTYYAISYVTKPTMYQTLELSTSSDDRGKGRTCFDIPIYNGLIWEGVQGEGNMPLQKLFYQRTVLSVDYWDEERQIKKKLVKSGVQGVCIYYELVQNNAPPLSNLTLL